MRSRPRARPRFRARSDAPATGLRPGSAEFLEIPSGDHELEIYPTAEDAYAYRGGRAQPELFLRPAVEWLRRATAAEAR